MVTYHGTICKNETTIYSSMTNQIWSLLKVRDSQNGRGGTTRMAIFTPVARWNQWRFVWLRGKLVLVYSTTRTGLPTNFVLQLNIVKAVCNVACQITVGRRYEYNDREYNKILNSAEILWDYIIWYTIGSESLICLYILFKISWRCYGQTLCKYDQHQSIAIHSKLRKCIQYLRCSLSRIKKYVLYLGSNNWERVIVTLKHHLY